MGCIPSPPNPSPPLPSVRAANMLLKLVWEDGKAAWELKLCDFGLACEAGTRRAVEVETVTNREWLAPELDTSCRTLEDGRVVRRVTAATDIFSLGETCQ